jgi:hypothetical protein
VNTVARYAITAGAAGLVGFAAASYLRPRVLTEARTEYVDRWHEVVTTRTVVDVRTRTVVQRVIEEKRPDGTEITTHETEGTETEVAARGEQRSEAEGSEAMDTVRMERRIQPSRFSVSFLAGLTLRVEPVYGAAVTYRVLGPITVGAWGLSSGVLGASLGVTW